MSQPGDAAWWERAQASQKRGKERRKERVARCRKGDLSQPGDAAWWENYRANRKRHVDQDNKRRRERIARCRQGIFSELGDEAWWQKKQDIKAKFDKCHSGSFADEEEREWYYAYCKEKSISPRGYERYTGPDRNWCCSLESCDRFKKPFKTKEGAAKHIRTHKDESPAVPRWGTDVSYTGEEAFCGDHNCDRYAQPFASLRAAVKHMRNVHQLDQASATSTVRKAEYTTYTPAGRPCPQDRKIGWACNVIGCKGFRRVVARKGDAQAHAKNQHDAATTVEKNALIIELQGDEQDDEGGVHVEPSGVVEAQETSEQDESMDES